MPRQPAEMSFFSELKHRNVAISNIRVDPVLDPLRGDPCFEALAEKIVPARRFTSTSK